jgi:AcrR family transcriptional regulator
MKLGNVKSAKKLTGDERRLAIIDAVRQVFAEKGFDGTTTRELALAAGVSEALLFKHFPNKEALYSAMQLACCNERDFDQLERLKTLEPSASTLVLLVHFLVSRCLVEPECNPDKAIHARLMLRSLTENGEFVRLCLQGLPSHLNQWMAASVRAAIAAGDAYDGPVEPGLGCWLTHHLATMIKAYMLPTPSVVDYGIAREKVVEQTVWYTLRGIGLKEEVIRRYYNPKALALFAE